MATAWQWPTWVWGGCGNYSEENPIKLGHEWELNTKSGQNTLYVLLYASHSNSTNH